MKKNILLVYGSGGHNAQMKRIYTELSKRKSNLNMISLCDSDVRFVLTQGFIVVDTVTDKFSYFKMILNTIFKSVKIIKSTRDVVKKYDLSAMLSTGPGLSIIVALYIKIFTNIRIVHIETWSRFYSKSITGRILYMLADRFYIQNIELKSLYPKSIYKGRL